MQTKVGDRLVRTNLGDRRRVGIATSVEHPDGSPPYLVQRLEGNYETVVFPGPTAQIESGRRAGRVS